MKKFILLVFVMYSTFAANAQYYGNGTLKVGNSEYTSKSSYRNEYTSDNSVSTSSWNGTAYGIGYASTFDDADKGGFGISVHGFFRGGKHIGMSMMWNGIYNLGTEKFFDYYQGLIGPNFNLPVTDNVILFAPLCLSMSSVGGSDKIYWGASLIPSVGIKFGSFFLSAGWNLSYNFSAKEDQFNSEQFAISLAIFRKD